MTLATLMSESVQVIRRTVTGEDSSGVEVVSFLPLTTANAFVGRRDTTESVDGRDLVIADHAFMFPAGTDVEPYDRLIHDGKTFEVVGLPKGVVKPGAGVQFKTVLARWMEG